MSGGAARVTVGREAELARIRDALSALADPRGGVLLLSGEPGVGKSHLLEWAGREARETLGARVLSGFALEASGMPPYFALERALRSLRPEIEDGSLRDLRPALSAAGIGAAATDGPRSAPLDHAAIFDAVAQLCERLSDERPLVLLLDDLQWADGETWEAIGYLARGIDERAILLMLAVRPEALRSGSAPAGRAITALARLRVLDHLALGRFDGAGVRQLARGLLGGPVAPELAGVLEARSEGNAFFAEEILRDLLDRGALVVRSGTWNLRDPSAASELEPPVSLRLSILGRVERLPAESREVLHAAAVLGRSFSPQVLADTVGRPLDAVEDAVAPAAEAGLVEPADGTWRFSHDTVREALYEDAGLHRRRWHAAAAAALERAGAGGADPERLAVLAFHREQAGEAREAAEAALEAARLALGLHAPGEALRHASRAERMLRDAEPLDPALSVEVAGILGDAALLAGEYERAETALRAGLRAVRIDREVSDEAAPASSRLGEARLWRRLGALQRRRERADEAIECLQIAAERLSGLDEDAARRELALVLVELATLNGVTRARYGDATASAERARALARDLGDAALEASAALTLGAIRNRSHGHEQARPLMREALERALAAGDPSLAAQACAAIANSCCWTGELSASRRAAERRLELARAAGDPFELRHTHSWLALLACYRGDWEEANSLLDEAGRILSRLESPEPVAFQATVRGLVRYRTGDANEAARLTGEALELFERVGPDTAVWYQGLHAQILLHAGDKNLARQHLDQLEQRIAAMPRSALPARAARAMMGLCYGELGEVERGEACERALLPYADDFHWMPVRRSLAALARLRGDPRSARAHLDAFETVARREGMRPDLALALLERAQLDPESGTRSRDLDEALALLGELGMRRDLDRARALQGGRPPAAAAFGLTPRELEVLELLASGSTNREIATALVLSERTVINHLSHIYQKTGTSNRAAAATMAVRLGLVGPQA